MTLVIKPKLEQRERLIESEKNTFNESLKKAERKKERMS